MGLSPRLFSPPPYYRSGDNHWLQSRWLPDLIRSSAEPSSTWDASAVLAAKPDAPSDAPTSTTLADLSSTLQAMDSIMKDLNLVSALSSLPSDLPSLPSELQSLPSGLPPPASPPLPHSLHLASASSATASVTASTASTSAAPASAASVSTGTPASPENSTNLATSGALALNPRFYAKYLPAYERAYIFGWRANVSQWRAWYERFERHVDGVSHAALEWNASQLEEEARQATSCATELEQLNDHLAKLSAKYEEALASRMALYKCQSSSGFLLKLLAIIILAIFCPAPYQTPRPPTLLSPRLAPPRLAPPPLPFPPPLPSLRFPSPRHGTLHRARLLPAYRSKRCTYR